jgi:hypothetical protein
MNDLSPSPADRHDEPRFRGDMDRFPWGWGGVIEWLYEVDWKAADRFLKEFVAFLPERLRRLEAKIRSTPGFETWRADFSPSSLDCLGAWALVGVATRPMTEEEKASERRQMAEALSEIVGPSILEPGAALPSLMQEWRWVDPDTAYTDLVTIAAYTGETLRRALPEAAKAKWRRGNGGKTWDEHNLPLMSRARNETGVSALHDGSGFFINGLMTGRAKPDCFRWEYDRLLTEWTTEA